MKLLCAFSLAVLSIAACDKDKDTSKPEPMVGPPYNSCVRDSDCSWGEIPHEIDKASDCICLYGCPYLPLSKETVARRIAQHEAKCEPRQDGHGDPCGIDDCNMPPLAACNQGTCGAADAGSP